MKKLLSAFLLISTLFSCKKEVVINPHFVGELYGGGIIVEVNKDRQGIEHGIIASLSDVAVKSPWSEGSSGGGFSNATSTTDGKANCQAIKLTLGLWGTACNVCLNFRGGDNSDWFLPSNTELYKIFYNQNIINRLLENDGDISTMPISPERYWTSTEDLNSANFTVDMLTGKIEYFGRISAARVRAIRRF